MSAINCLGRLIAPLSSSSLMSYLSFVIPLLSDYLIKDFSYTTDYS